MDIFALIFMGLISGGGLGYIFVLWKRYKQRVGSREKMLNQKLKVYDGIKNYYSGKEINNEKLLKENKGINEPKSFFDLFRRGL